VVLPARPRVALRTESVPWIAPMRNYERFPRCAHSGVAGFAVVVAMLVSCSTGSPGASCPPPLLLSSTSCSSCITTACMANVESTCNAGGAFSNCYCPCISAGGTPASCTLSCASSSCKGAALACIQKSLAGGSCAGACGTTSTDAGGEGGSDGHGGDSAAPTCMYTLSGAQSGSGSCSIVLDGYASTSNELIPPCNNSPCLQFEISGLANGGTIGVAFLSTAKLSATQYTSGTVVDSNCFLADGSGSWLECVDNASGGKDCLNDMDKITNQGSLTVTITSTGEPSNIGGGTLWVDTHGSLIATMPAGGGMSNPATGTVTMKITF
jgi:hypothetical protein